MDCPEFGAPPQTTFLVPGKQNSCGIRVRSGGTLPLTVPLPRNTSHELPDRQARPACAVSQTGPPISAASVCKVTFQGRWAVLSGGSTRTFQRCIFEGYHSPDNPEILGKRSRDNRSGKKLLRRR